VKFKNIPDTGPVITKPNSLWKKDRPDFAGRSALVQFQWVLFRTARV